jgi:hypothetical protein
LNRISSSFSILAFIGFLFFSSEAFAQVQTRIRVIEASNVGSLVDPSLEDVHNELGSLFNFTSYRLLRDLNLSLLGNRPVKIPIHGGRSMEVTLVGEYKNTVELKLKILRGRTTILDTRVRLSSGRTILIGGPRHGEGVIIFAVSSRF